MKKFLAYLSLVGIIKCTEQEGINLKSYSMTMQSSYNDGIDSKVLKFLVPDDNMLAN